MHNCVTFLNNEILLQLQWGSKYWTTDTRNIQIPELYHYSHNKIVSKGTGITEISVWILDCSVIH